MTAVQLYISLVEGVGEDVVVMGARLWETIEKPLHLAGSTHSSKLEVAQPQFVV
jgi:hypothetical protein